MPRKGENRSGVDWNDPVAVRQYAREKWRETYTPTPLGHARGEAHGLARLTWADVRAIRQDRAAGASQKALARQYGVAKRTVQNILNNKTWKEDA